MRAEIRKKIEMALAAKHGLAVPAAAPPSLCSVPTPDLLSQAMTERQHALGDIAERHGLSYWTVQRQLRGRPGYLQFGSAIRITESLYREWLQEAISKGQRAQ